MSEFDPRTQIDWAAGAAPDVQGQECIACRKLYTFRSGMYNRNSSYRYGYEIQCTDCQSAPRMSIVEHTARLQQMNLNSEATKRQRHRYQEDMKLDRSARSMDCQLFLSKLLHILPTLFVNQGGVKGDLALYITGAERRDWNNQSFKYMGYITIGNVPEFSTYEFDRSRDVMIRTKDRGWREILLHFIEEGFLTEKQCNTEFGPPSGGVHSTWFKELRRIRRTKQAA